MGRKYNKFLFFIFYFDLIIGEKPGHNELLHDSRIYYAVESGHRTVVVYIN